VKRSPGRNDAELLLVVLFWAFNVSVVKISLAHMRPLAFNMIRFACAAIVLLGLTRWLEGSLGIARRDLGRVVLMGAVGHAVYQLCFVLGLARTTASSTALIFGSTPVLVGILSRLAGHERIRLPGAIGAMMAFYGVYLVVSGGDAAAPFGRAAGAELTGDLLVLGAAICWSVYTVMSKDLLDRYSPLRVTALSLSIGSAMMLPPALPDLLRQDWGSVPPLTWAGLTYSFVFALVVSYVLWYRSVKQVGNLRTAIYSNLVPVLGTLFGVWLLGERPAPGVVLGGACILGGIVLTRLPGARAVAPIDPAESGIASP
jgi:drug/metabolite transporter (DMT)-like permease